MAEPGGRCDFRDGFIHPAFPSRPPGRVKPSGLPRDPYDQSVPVPSQPGCQAITRT